MSQNDKIFTAYKIKTRRQLILIIQSRKTTHFSLVLVLACSIGISSCTNNLEHSTSPQITSIESQVKASKSKGRYRVEAITPGVHVVNSKEEAQRLVDKMLKETEANSSFATLNADSISPADLTPGPLTIELNSDDAAGSSYKTSFQANAGLNRLVIAENISSPFETYIILSYNAPVQESVELVIYDSELSLIDGNHSVVVQGINVSFLDYATGGTYNPYTCNHYNSPYDTYLNGDVDMFDYLGAKIFQEGVYSWQEAQTICRGVFSPISEASFITPKPTPTPTPTPTPEPEDCEDEILLPEDFDLEQNLSRLNTASYDYSAEDPEIASATDATKTAQRHMDSLDKLNYSSTSELLDPEITREQMPEPDPQLPKNKQNQIEKALDSFFEAKSQFPGSESYAQKLDSIKALQRDLEEKTKEISGKKFSGSDFVYQPVSLYDYELTIENLSIEFEDNLSQGNTFSTLLAIEILTQELEILHQLISEHLDGYFAGRPNLYGSSAQQLIQKLVENIQKHSAAEGIPLSLEQTNAALTDNLDQSNEALNEIRLEVLKSSLLILFETGLIDPDTLEFDEAFLSRYSDNNFSIQSSLTDPITNCASQGVTDIRGLMNCLNGAYSSNPKIQKMYQNADEANQLVKEKAEQLLAATQGGLDKFNAAIATVRSNPILLDIMVANSQGLINYTKLTPEELQLRRSQMDGGLELIQKFVVPQDNFDLSLEVLQLKKLAAVGVIGRESIESMLEILGKLRKQSGHSKQVLRQMELLEQSAKEALEKYGDDITKLCRKGKTACRREVAKRLLDDYATFTDDFKDFLARFNKFENIGQQVVKKGKNYKIGVKKIRNAKTNGKQELEELKTGILSQVNKYSQQGVGAKPNGFPDLSSYIVRDGSNKPITVDFNDVPDFVMAGDRPQDFKRADALAVDLFKRNGYIPQNATARDVEKLRRSWGLSWHHSEDLHTMELVPEAIHGSYSHSGSVSLLNKLKTEKVSRNDWVNYTNDPNVPAVYFDR